MISYVLLFNGGLIYGTIVILILVNMIHFFASPYLIAYSSLCRFNDKLEDAASAMGIGRVHMSFDVYIPCVMDSLVELFSYIFVNCMVTICALSFLANFRDMPLSLMIPQFDTQAPMEETRIYIDSYFGSQKPSSSSIKTISRGI